MRDKANLVFVGPSGVGKTHLSNAIGQLACLRGMRVRFVTAADLVNDLVAADPRIAMQKATVAAFRVTPGEAPRLRFVLDPKTLEFAKA